jgi:glycosyltransferase involved in cell wall biosynthesis
MKILYVIHEFFPNHYTGTARFALNLAMQMQRMGNTIKILTYGETDDDLTMRSGKILYKKYFFNTLEVWSFRHDTMIPSIHFDIFNHEIESDICRFIELEKLDHVDMVHIIHPLRTGVIVQYFHKKKIPLIMTLTDYWTLCPRVQLLKPDNSLCNGPSGDKCSMECGFPLKKIADRIAASQILMKYPQVITVPSTLVKKIFTLNGYPEERFSVINHGLDYGQFHIMPHKTYSPGAPVVFGYVGPVTPQKGLDLLISAFKRVPGNILLKIYGTHLNQNEYLIRLKTNVESDPRIEFMGEYRYEELPEIFSGIDVEIFASIWYETYCLALLEGLAHSIPIIASDTIGSALEFLDNQSRVIFASRDQKHLMDRIKYIRDNPEVLYEMTQNICYPPRIEEEAISYEQLYWNMIR